MGGGVSGWTVQHPRPVVQFDATRPTVAVIVGIRTGPVHPRFQTNRAAQFTAQNVGFQGLNSRRKRPLVTDSREAAGCLSRLRYAERILNSRAQGLLTQDIRPLFERLNSLRRVKLNRRCDAD